MKPLIQRRTHYLLATAVVAALPLLTQAASFEYRQPVRDIAVKIQASAGTTAVSPGVLTFPGTEVAASSSSQRVTLSNNSDQPITVAAPQVTGDYLVNSSCAGNLSARESCTIDVTFKPAGLEQRPGTLSINTSAGIKTVSLAGTGIPKPGDQFFDSVVFLSHFDGTNGSLAYVDSSKYKAKPYRSFSAGISTADAKFGGASLRYHNFWQEPSWGSAHIAFPNASQYNFGTGDFTIEYWAKNSSYGCWGVPAVWRGVPGAYNWSVLYRQDGRPAFRVAGATGTTIALELASPTVIPANTWTHFAVSKSGGVTRLFVNGTVQATSAAGYSMEPFTTSSDLVMGNNYSQDGNGCHNTLGFVDELRITKGVGRYTSNFTLQSAPFEER